MSSSTFLPEPVAEWLLLVTWLLVIPYIIMFPPKLVKLRKTVEAKIEANVVKSVTLRPNWLSKAAEGKESPKGKEEVGQQVVVPRGKMAVVVFINRRSGGQVGASLLGNFKSLNLHSLQVVDLAEQDPKSALGRYKKCPTSSVRLLVAGGDGTVGWVMGAAEELNCPFPIAILPLGTGNDLSRTFYWGSGFSAAECSVTRVKSHIAMVAQAEVVNLDRWVVTVEDKLGERRLPMNNYFSLGIDAEISCKFHQERELHPERFTSQQHNVMKYAFYGFEGAFEGTPLEDSVTVTRLEDGSTIDVNPLWKGVIISNVPCYHGGKNFWGDGSGDTFTPASVNDGLLEVMGVAGTLHIGLINLAIDNAIRLDQCGGIMVEVPEKHEMCFQVDGEPWRQQGPAKLKLQLTGQYPMLQARQEWQAAI